MGMFRTLQARAAKLATRWFSAYSSVAVFDFDYDIGELAEISSLPAIRRAWQKVATNIAASPLSVLDASGKPVGREHAGLRLLTGSTGTNGLSSMQWRRWEALCAQRHGIAYTLIHRTSAGTPMRLEPLAPNQVREGIGEYGPLYEVNGTLVDESNMIVQRWDADAENPYAGVSPVTLGCRDAMRNESARQTAWRRVLNTGLVGKWWVTKEHAISKTTANELKDRYHDKHPGVHEIDVPAIFQENLKPQAFAPDAAARFMDARREGVKETALCTDVPPAMLYENDGRSMGEVMQLYASDLADRLALFADEYARKLCRLGETVHIGTGRLMLADVRTGYRGVSMAYTSGLVTRNEGRERLGGLAPATDAESNEFQLLISGVTGQQGDEGAAGEGENGGAE